MANHRPVGQVLYRTARFTIANADIVMPFAVSLGLTALSLTGTASTNELIAGTLAVLALLSLSAVRDRLQRDEIMGATLQLRSELSAVSGILGSRQAIHISKDQTADNAYLSALIRELPSISGAKFVALSGRDTRAFVEQVLERSDCVVKLLMKHPETVGEIQQRWILAELDRMQAYLIPQYGERLHIRCYRQPYSLRGRKIEPHVVDVGWYTPLPGDKREIVGHIYPLVVARLDSDEGVALGKMFDDVFDALWTASDSVDASTILGS
jgi:hypothetical protein